MEGEDDEMKEWIGYQKGINLGGWLSQCVYQKEHYDTFIVEEDLKIIGNWGLDHVRLPIDYEVLETEDGKVIEEGYQYLDNCLQWCKKYQLNMIIDLHKTAGYSFDDIERNTLFDNEDLKRRFINLWVNISKRYAKEEKHVAFELLNEVANQDSQRWNQLIKEVIIEIRKYAPNHKIVVGGIQWNSVNTLHLLEEPYDENIVYTFHFYEPFLFTHQKAEWVAEIPREKSMLYPATLETFREASKAIGCFGSGLYNEGVTTMGKSYIESMFMQAIEIARKRNTYLYCGEYGVIYYADPNSSLSWYKDMNETFKKYNIGRAAWTYKGIHFGIRDEQYSSIIEELVPCL